MRWLKLSTHNVKVLGSQGFLSVLLLSMYSSFFRSPQMCSLGLIDDSKSTMDVSV